MDKLKIIAPIVVICLLLAAIPFVVNDDDGSSGFKPSVDLPEGRYMILTSVPASEEERINIASLACLAVEEEDYNPFFIMEDGGLDAHQLWTISHLVDFDMPVLLFTPVDGNSLYDDVETQLKGIGWDNEITEFTLTRDTMRDFKGFDGTLNVETFEEAMWASPIAARDNLMILPGKQTYTTQEEVWDDLYQNGLEARYIIVANPDDYMEMSSEVPNHETDEVFTDSYHIPNMALISPELAAFRDGYVITQPEVPDPIPEEFDDLYPSDQPELNLWPIGMLLALRNLTAEYSPSDLSEVSIALVGSAEAVPHFELVDWSGSEPDWTSSDSLYGFLDDDPLNMDSGVGRIVNYNVQGVTNQMVRTFLYDDLVETVTVEYENGDVRTTTWRSHGLDANGFEVADMRGQNSPGIYATEDYDDEGYTSDRIETGGQGYSVSANDDIDLDVEGFVQSAGHLLYRGHGSWHGTLYTWGYYSPANPYGERMVEGDAARELFIPPQVTLLFSCENTKIHGLTYGGDPIEMERVFATSWMYAGAVALIGATEVSYSNIGQDIYGFSGLVTGQYNWDLNNLWFASTAKYTLDEEYAMGEVLRRSENRYLDKHPGITPLQKPEDPDADGAHWKEVAMYALIGDPAFQYHITSEGQNDVMRWD